MIAPLSPLVVSCFLLLLSQGAFAENDSRDQEAEQAVTISDQLKPDLIGNPERAADLARMCTSCHGYQGRSVTSRYPSIAGMDEAQFIEGMQALQAGERGHLMASMTRNLSEQDIADLAAFYAQFDNPERAGTDPSETDSSEP
ncbi:c-type cytochrome [Billgrantia kenyensis]|uniref:C-type cytochrome n=1 Tax=Billgrantia kenyensis TaxID=321266 RepID=A0A7V9W4S4_9GAMM|nr:c-type cytochrome [Halomonas kenyensis]MBA2781052.1 c-type cytochrome [Halomonas kenyensis]MCG6661503.1 c-type cytochrome [Halomonas kenyensis]